MAKARANPSANRTPSFRPRRAIAPVGDAAEKRVVIRAYMPVSLAKDINLYALERECSVSDLLNSILRKAIPSLKIVSNGPKGATSRVDLDSAPDAETNGAGPSLHDDADDQAELRGRAA